MTTDGIAIARQLLDRFEAALAAEDHATLDGLCADDTVLFGSSRANFGTPAAQAYIRLVLESTTDLRWLLETWAVVHQDDTHLLVAAEGEIEVDEGEGLVRHPFRLTLYLVKGEQDWQIKHFHGSLPDD